MSVNDPQTHPIRRLCFEAVLILFVVAWTAWAGQRTEDGEA